jgi:beta-lactamase regulating signal transducer with metallopeptidase domain
MLSVAFLFGAAAKATAILAAAWLLALAMRRRSAAARYFIWTCALAAVLAVPAISPFLPRWDLRVKTTPVAAVPRAAVIVNAAPELAADNSGSPEPVRTRWNAAWLVTIWLAGVAIMLARIGVGHLRLALSLRRAPAVRAPEWIAARDSAGERIGLRRNVTLRRSGEIDVPLTGGVFAAWVVLPETAEEWDSERRYIVLLHELTHARRRDPLLWLMAQVAVALYWFHPHCSIRAAAAAG